MRRFVGTTAKLSAGFWDEVARLAGQGQPEPEPLTPTEPAEATVDHDDPPSVNPDTTSGSGVLVPLDTWTRVMDQLGNLHEAGQQLAEARERAARAETQVEFLREQLADTRRDLEASRKRQTKPRTPKTAPPAPPQVDAAAEPAPAQPAGRVNLVRARLGTWLRPD